MYQDKEFTTVIFPNSFIKLNKKQYLLLYSVNDKKVKKKIIKKKFIESNLIYDKRTNFENVNFILE